MDERARNLRSCVAGDATALAAAIAEGRTTASTAMMAALGRAREVPSAIARLLSDEAALAAAERAGAGPFTGVPFLGKDLGSAARGLAPAGGCGALRARLADPSEDSALFARFRAGGLVPFGLSTVPEFGMSLATEPPGQPPAANPFDPARSAGGSSGGASVAVAEGVVAIAHATDAAGSIRVPAASCGLWGLKPSRGVVPQGPTFANYLMGIVSELVLARSRRDVVTAYALATGMKPASEGRRDWRVALCLPDRCDEVQRGATRAAAETLAASGADIVERPAPDALGQAAHAAAGLVLCVSLAEWLDDAGIAEGDVSPFIASARASGRALTGTAVFAASRDIARLTHAASMLFEGVDAALMPVLSGPPPPHRRFPMDADDVGARLAALEAHAPNAALANVAGLPALAFPAGFVGGLPVGAQLIGPQGADAALLELAAP
ncbi:MAG: amidase, partial [Pseudomonadota bacterium]